jgi:hypothetical protein
LRGLKPADDGHDDERRVASNENRSLVEERRYELPLDRLAQRPMRHSHASLCRPLAQSSIVVIT